MTALLNSSVLLCFFLENLDKKGLLSRSLSSLRNLAPSATFLLNPNTAFDSCLGLKCMKKEVGSIGIFSIFKALFLSNRAYWCLQFLFVGFAIKCYQNTNCYTELSSSWIHEKKRFPRVKNCSPSRLIEEKQPFFSSNPFIWRRGFWKRVFASKCIFEHFIWEAYPNFGTIRENKKLKGTVFQKNFPTWE